jgi:anti-sigma factor RsiW
VKCREFAEFIADYLSGELEVEPRSAFDRHIDRCANCRAYLSNYRDTIALGRGAFADDDADVPGDVPDDLVKAILASRRTRS